MPAGKDIGPFNHAGMEYVHYEDGEFAYYESKTNSYYNDRGKKLKQPRDNREDAAEFMSLED